MRKYLIDKYYKKLEGFLKRNRKAIAMHLIKLCLIASMKFNLLSLCYVLFYAINIYGTLDCWKKHDF